MFFWWHCHPLFLSMQEFFYASVGSLSLVLDLKCNFEVRKFSNVIFRRNFFLWGGGVGSLETLGIFLGLIFAPICTS